jgi:hypothetical protein
MMIVLLGWYFSSITVFFHSHFVNGVKVSHSHPYSDDNPHSPVKGHKHSTSCYYLSISSDGSCLVNPVLNFDPVIFYHKIELSIKSAPVIPDLLFGSGHALRAPPLS